ncbi:MAG: HAD-IB family phosphatase [bacterium]|nr:HAD-IB family phosphatase [bacterium]
MKETYYIFDFDSTFTQVEAMEELAEISLANDPEKEFLIEKIKQLTDLAMEGSMPFGKSLRARIALLSAKKYHLNMLVNRLRKRVSTSFIRNKQFFKEHKGRVFIVSGGFREFIEPIVKPYFIDSEHVFANTFVYDKKNNIIGADEDNVLSKEQGKVKLLKQLKLAGKVVFIGDGYTDYEVFELGQADQFFAYTENVSRAKVLEKSEWIAPSLDEILFTEKLPMSISYPKTRLKAVLWGEETFLAEPKLKGEGYKIVKLAKKIGKVALNLELGEAHVLLFSPGVDLGLVQTEKSKLLTAGVWGTLVDDGYLDLFARSGVVLFGGEYSHTRSEVELSLMMLLQLNRNMGEELLGKRLGIIGYGHSGSMLSVMAEQLGMEVFYYDVLDKPALGNAKKLKQVGDLLRKCNNVVVASGQRFKGVCLVGTKELKQMLFGSVLINMGYEENVEEEACSLALERGKLGGFGMDYLTAISGKVVSKKNNVLLGLNQRMMTKQTQVNIAQILSERVIDFVNTGSTAGSLNFPGIHLPALQQMHRFIHIHRNMPGVLAQINGILAQHKINVSGQYLKTLGEIGYVITDVSKEYGASVVSDLRSIDETLKFRVLY